MIPDGLIPHNNTIDTILSVVLIYALLSILVSVLIEWWQAYQKSRSAFLKKAILQLLNDPLNLDFGSLFYTHFQIDGMKNKFSDRGPAYISSTVFAQVLMDIIGDSHRNARPVKLKAAVDGEVKEYRLGDIERPEGISTFEQGLNSLRPSPFSETILSLWERSGRDRDKMTELLARWYDDYMDRVGGWFKKEQRNTFRVFGFLVAIVLNADTLHMLKMISYDDNMRARLVETAEHVSGRYTTLSDSLKATNSGLLRTFQDVPIDTSVHLIPDSIRMKTLTKTLTLNDSLGRVSMQKADSVMAVAAALNIPLGWDKNTAPLSWLPKRRRDLQPDSNYTYRPPIPEYTGRSSGVAVYLAERNAFSGASFFWYLTGIVITGFALSFGAPFWFSTMVKLINIRRVGSKPEPTNTKK